MRILAPSPVFTIGLKYIALRLLRFIAICETRTIFNSNAGSTKRALTSFYIVTFAMYVKHSFVRILAVKRYSHVDLHYTESCSLYRGLIKLAALALVATGGVAQADTITIGASQDATIFGSFSGMDTGTASGMGPGLFTGADGQLGIKRALIKYDVEAAGIPANSIINDVTMTLSLGQTPTSGGLPQTIRLFAIDQNWSEGSSGTPTSSSISGSGPGYPRENGDTTWNYSSYHSDPALAVKWSDGGNELPGGNFSEPESASSTFSNYSVGSTFSWNSTDMAADVQDWLNGTLPNNGWLLKSDLESTPRSALAFWAKDGAMATGDTVLAPTLQINYSPIPEPATYATLLTGLVMLGLVVHRRKRDIKYTT